MREEDRVFDMEYDYGSTRYPVSRFPYSYVYEILVSITLCLNFHLYFLLVPTMFNKRYFNANSFYEILGSLSPARTFINDF